MPPPALLFFHNMHFPWTLCTVFLSTARYNQLLIVSCSASHTQPRKSSSGSPLLREPNKRITCPLALHKLRGNGDTYTGSRTRSQPHAEVAAPVTVQLLPHRQEGDTIFCNYPFTKKLTQTVFSKLVLENWITTCTSMKFDPWPHIKNKN